MAFAVPLELSSIPGFDFGCTKKKPPEPTGDDIPGYRLVAGISAAVRTYCRLFAWSQRLFFTALRVGNDSARAVVHALHKFGSAPRNGDVRAGGRYAVPADMACKTAVDPIPLERTIPIPPKKASIVFAASTYATLVRIAARHRRGLPAAVHHCVDLTDYLDTAIEQGARILIDRDGRQTELVVR